MLNIKRIFTGLLTAIIVLSTLFSALPTAEAAANKVYYSIDFSQEVFTSRITQKVSGDCAVVSMATIEAYLHGAVTDADKSVVYNAVLKANTDDNYAYWGNCGYLWHETIDWESVYHQLSAGYPVIVHRPAANGNSQHWSVVAGYTGSSTTLEPDQFIIVEVYDGKTDIFTSAQWGEGTVIDRMVTRRYGLAITELSGIRIAINHPPAVHTYGIGHGVFGQISADAPLTSVQIMVTNLASGSDVYNKTVEPNGKSYSLLNQDAAITFGKYPEGEYFYTVIAKTEDRTAYRQYYFTIGSSWPETRPSRKLTFTFDPGISDQMQLTQSVEHGSVLTIPTQNTTKNGCTFKGYAVKRLRDNTWYCGNLGWYTQEQLQASGASRKLYTGGETYTIDYAWMIGSLLNQGFAFYGIWENGLGQLLDGWQLSSGKWYCYEKGVIIRNDWRKDSKGWCYLGDDGAMLTNRWVEDSKGWCYVGADGCCLTDTWKKDSVGWVYLDKEGSMIKKQWLKDGNTWYYLDARGYMVFNQWVKDSVGWCWLTASGAMATDRWVEDSKGWCYVGANGYCWTNCWAKDSVGWVWLDSEGSMVYNKWIEDSDDWYYIGADGYMLANTTWNGYHFNASGICTNP